jgi:signal transduction histidine kinase
MDVTERKQADEIIRHYSERLAIINRLDHVISSSLDIGSVYDAFVLEMKALVKYERTAIILLDEEGENWQIMRQWTEGKPAFQPSKWYPIQGTAVGWVMEHQQAYLEETLGDQIKWQEHEGLRKEGIQCRVLLPLIIQGKVTGLLTLASRQPKVYQQSDLELLQTLADQLAIALQNANLYAQARLTATELEQRVQARTSQLEMANKDLESFSYSVSHDLRAPLRAINGFAQILARRHRECLDEEGQHYMDNVVEASTRMGILIDDLLQYSRVGRSSVRRQAVSLDDLFAQIIGDLSSRISETQAVIELPPAGMMPGILSDPTILGQIFTNIIENALTYYRPNVPPFIRLTYQVEAGHHLFEIADNGIGIPAEYLEKIFNVFQRLHTIEEYPGTGIGLAIVKKSADLLGGRVWAGSTEGCGSTFWIQIPKE